jgi:iron-sulfur cluster protein
VEGLFRSHHPSLDPARDLSQPETLVAEARQMLRPRYFAADVGITGANFLVAETGSTVIVTNEGNGDLTQSLPRVHVVLSSIEKIVPGHEDAATLLRVLARSATGQDMSVYTTFSCGPRRPGDADGPDAFHVVLVDNGRSAMLGTEFQEMLRCIKCGACMNHCPVYGAIGGHAYDAVYMGPMGAVLTPQIEGLFGHTDLPAASTFCGRCAEVCPMGIPLPDLMRRWREKSFAAGWSPSAERWGLGLWSALARRPWAYRLVARVAAAVLARRIRAFDPFPGAQTLWQGQPLKIWSAQALPVHAQDPLGSDATAATATDPSAAPSTADHLLADPAGTSTPGQVLQANAQGLDVATGDGVLRLLQLQKPGGKRLGVADFLRGGAADWRGQMLGA